MVRGGDFHCRDSDGDAAGTPGFAKGLLAILVGHVIGGLVMFGAGLIGGRTGRSAMETVEISFGHQGAKLFAGLNVIQLIGWTAVMIASAAAAGNTWRVWGSRPGA